MAGDTLTGARVDLGLRDPPAQALLADTDLLSLDPPMGRWMGRCRTGSGL